MRLLAHIMHREFAKLGLYSIGAYSAPPQPVFDASSQGSPLVLMFLQAQGSVFFPLNGLSSPSSMGNEHLKRLDILPFRK
jgi:hypothetical protein